MGEFTLQVFGQRGKMAHMRKDQPSEKGDEKGHLFHDCAILVRPDNDCRICNVVITLRRDDRRHDGA